PHYPSAARGEMFYGLWQSICSFHHQHFDGPADMNFSSDVQPRALSSPEAPNRLLLARVHGVSIGPSLIVVLLITFSGCGQNGFGFKVGGGEAAVGQQLIFSFACGSCHMIPGIAEANGTVGPPLQ